MPGYGTSSSSASTTQHPGRSAPVRGVASQQSSTQSTTTSARNHVVSTTSSSTSLPRNGQQYSSQSQTIPRHPLGWDRPYSSGMPAPAVAVPIFRAAHATDMSFNPFDAHRRQNTAQLPDSPPDTPPHSPGLHPVRLPTFVEPRLLSQQSQPQRVSPPRLSTSNERLTRSQDVPIESLYTGQTPCDSELESNADTEFSDDASDATLDQLTQAAQTLLLHQSAGADRIKSQHPSSDSSIASAHLSGISVELMPATPEISPDNDVRHHAQKSAHAFLHRIFASVPTNLSVEDAGVELVSPGWSGAVIKSGPATHHASSSFSSTCSSDSSADAQRTLYVSMPAVVDASLLREQVLAVLDAASEKLGCDSVMVCLDKAMRDFSSVLHGLCYVGGAMVAAAKEKAQEELSIEANKLPNADPVSGLQLRDGLVLVAIEL